MSHRAQRDALNLGDALVGEWSPATLRKMDERFAARMRKELQQREYVGVTSSPDQRVGRPRAIDKTAREAPGKAPR